MLKRILFLLLFPLITAIGILAMAAGMPWALGEWIIKGKRAEGDPFYLLMLYLDLIAKLLE